MTCNITILMLRLVVMQVSFFLLSLSWSSWLSQLFSILLSLL